jgi:hypothetical protein
MARRICLIIMALMSMGYFSCASHNGEMEKAGGKTATPQTGGIVCDLNGEWNALYHHYGAVRSVGNITSMVKITQQGAKFVGTSLIDSEFSRAGTEKFTGELGEGGIKNAKYNRPDIGWTDARGKISKDCNRMVIDDGKGVELTLERK